MSDWSNEQCLALIDLYKQFPVLWNPKDIWYNSKNKKLEAWDMIAEQLAVDVKIVRQKMLSLLGSFRAQKSKGKRIIETNKGKRDVYVSKWFAFERMQFLLDREPPKNNFKVETEPLEGGEDWDLTIDCDPFASLNTDDDTLLLEQIDQPELIEIIHEQNDPLEEHEISQNKQEYVMQPVPKRIKKIKEEKLSAECFKLTKDYTIHHTSSRTIDNFTVYGQHLANKLRSYPRRTRIITEHMINNILFAADMGHYENINCNCYLRIDHLHNCNASNDVVSSTPTEYEMSPTPVPVVDNKTDVEESILSTKNS